MSRPWYRRPVQAPSGGARHPLRQRIDQRFFPPGALGHLETIIRQLGDAQERPDPRVEPVHVTVFAADHGVARHGLSALPPEASLRTAQSLLTGKALLNRQLRRVRATLEVVDLGMFVAPPAPLPGLISNRLGEGSYDILSRPGMDLATFSEALYAGESAVRRAREQGANLFVGINLGSGGSTSAAAIATALLGLAPHLLADSGTLSADTSPKIEAIQRAVNLHLLQVQTPVDLLRHLGGFDIAALTGAFIACGHERIPALVDGFVATTAALVASHLHPSLRHWLIYAHQGGGRGHRHMFEILTAEPLLRLELRGGQGLGSGFALPLLAMLCDLMADEDPAP
ncbi:MAG: nicotinate-nucleotide--dimethylbenzimidazole phosphoribosyltransferase [Magnetococcus sp. WYHC-3]